MPVSAAAETVYAAARPRLLQIRTLLTAAGKQSSLGSGFVVTADGMAITNYHVVSQYALEPATYRMEYATPEGTKGALKLLAVDVTNDLAVVQLDKNDYPFFTFNPRAIDGSLAKGERMYAMGNPHDIGFTIVEGTYNNLVDKSYQERIHFSGAMNPGMSGGPTVSVDGRVIGINVAKRVGSDLVSFLVPARFGAALLERARHTMLETRAGAQDLALTPEKTRIEIGKQLTAWQAALYKTLLEQGFRTTTSGPYQAPEPVAAWFSCWARTNGEQIPKPRALLNSTQCNTQTWLFISNNLQTGAIEISHSYAKSIDLNAFQFAAFLSQNYNLAWSGSGGRKYVTQNQCTEDFVVSGTDNAKSLPMRVVWCAKAFRDFPEIYNVSVLAVTQDKSDQALISRLAMSGVSYANALALGKRFISSISVAEVIK